MEQIRRTWIVRWNPKLYNVQSRYSEALENPITIKQSKGRARMRIVPQIGDSVAIAWKSHIHMRGKVVQGFINGTEHQEDEENIGDNRPHAEPEYYATLEIKSVPNPVRIPFTGQRT